MGARRASTVKRDKFVNRLRGRLAWNSDSSVASYETIETGMNVGRADPFKWVITGFMTGPCGTSDYADEVQGNNIWVVQLSLGTQTALLEPDDMQVVTQILLSKRQYAGASPTGDYTMQFPVVAPILAPIPVFASKLSIVFDAAVTDAGTNSTEWFYEIDYVAAPIAQDEIVEYLAAFGQV